jgi:hypothetical protein
MVEIVGNGIDDDCNILTADEDCIDNDGDGYGAVLNPYCLNPEVDCDDNDPNANPGMTEIPGNGIDDDCNPFTLDEDCIDNDGDGYGAVLNPYCLHPELEDCDDANPNVNPGMTEIPLNGIDDDCNPYTSDDPAADWSAATPADASVQGTHSEKASGILNYLGILVLPLVMIVFRNLFRGRTGR